MEFFLSKTARFSKNYSKISKNNYSIEQLWKATSVILLQQVVGKSIVHYFKKAAIDSDHL